LGKRQQKLFHDGIKKTCEMLENVGWSGWGLRW
jgi:hypothetical protein